MSEDNFLKISGSGTTGGGEFEGVYISGSGKVNGDVKCKEFKISGSGNIIGSVYTDDFKISGSGKIEGNLKCTNGRISGSGGILGNLTAEEFKISGSGKVNGNSNCQWLKISGDGKILGNVLGKTFIISGEAFVEKNIEVENFEARGNFKVNGMINADEVIIQLQNHCYVEEIGATKVDVRKGATINSIFKVISFFAKNFLGYLNTKIIEADYIYIEYTKADIVRGENIVIGEGCEIGLVEYKNSFKEEGNSKIIEKRKL